MDGMYSHKIQRYVDTDIGYCSYVRMHKYIQTDLLIQLL